MSRTHHSSGGQSTAEFAIASVVIVLLVAGLVDIGRAFFYSVTLQNAAREGARHGVWFNETQSTNPYLSSSSIRSAVDDILTQNGLAASQLGSPLCPTTSDGNTNHNPPYVSSAYISTVNKPVLYVCYNNDPSSTDPPTCSPNCWGQDLNVIVLLSYGTITGILQTEIAGAFHMAANQHMDVQGHS